MKSTRTGGSKGGKGEIVLRKGKDTFPCYRCNMVGSLWLVVPSASAHCAPAPEELLDLASAFGCRLHRSVVACKDLAVHGRICVRLGCLHHLFMHLIWEMSTQQRFLMAGCHRKHPLFCKLITPYKAPNPGVVLSEGNTHSAVRIWKRSFTGEVVRRFFRSRTIHINKLWAVSCPRLSNHPSAQVFSAATKRATHWPALAKGSQMFGSDGKGQPGPGGPLESPSLSHRVHRHLLCISWMGRSSGVDWQEGRAALCRTQSVGAGSWSVIGYVPTSFQLFHLCDSLWETSGTASDWHVTSYRKLRKIKAATRDNKTWFYAS